MYSKEGLKIEIYKVEHKILFNMFEELEALSEKLTAMQLMQAKILEEMQQQRISKKK